MSDWAPGDLALCVRGGFFGGRPDLPLEYPRAGAVYTVRQFLPSYRFNHGTLDGLCLTDGPPNRRGDRVWDVRRFRRIPPLTDEETREFIADLQDGKPALEPVNDGGCDLAHRDRFAPVSLALHSARLAGS